jgi:DsbC/DsbD-like thiol-disulfide interchange protein
MHSTRLIFWRTCGAIALIAGVGALIGSEAFAAEPTKPGLPGVAKPLPDGNALVRPSLIAEGTALVPSSENWIAVALEIEPGWHTYWRNNGETGVPLRFTFTTPEWITVGDPVWPAPVRHELASGGVDYVYEGQALILFPVRVNDEDRAVRSDAEISARVDWLVCHELCLPGSRTVSLTLPVSREAAQSPGAPAIRDARSRVASPTRFSAGFHASVLGDTLTIKAPGAAELEFFPYESTMLASPVDALDHGFSLTGTIRFQYDRSPIDAPVVAGVVRMLDADGNERFLEITVPVRAEADH